MSGTALAVNGAALVGRSLPELELVIERGLQTFVEVGQALKEIRDRDLHNEAGYSNFDTYCQQRWGFNRQRASQLIGAAEVTEGVSKYLDTPSTPLPVNDNQARALNPLKKEPETMAAAWQEAVETAPNGKVTAAHVAEVVERYTEPERYTDPAQPLTVRSEALERAERAAPLLERLTRRLRRTAPDAFGLRDRLELERLLETVVRCLARADQIRPGEGETPPPDLSGVSPRQAEIIGALRQNRGGLTQAEIQQATGMPEPTAWTALRLLCDRRVVVKAEQKRGQALVYLLAEGVPE